MNRTVFFISPKDLCLSKSCDYQVLINVVSGKVRNGREERKTNVKGTNVKQKANFQPEYSLSVPVVNVNGSTFLFKSRDLQNSLKRGGLLCAVYERYLRTKTYLENEKIESIVHKY